jgi:hypothetical protein
VTDPRAPIRRGTLGSMEQPHGDILGIPVTDSQESTLSQLPGGKLQGFERDVGRSLPSPSGTSAAVPLKRPPERMPGHVLQRRRRERRTFADGGWREISQRGRWHVGAGVRPKGLGRCPRSTGEEASLLQGETVRPQRSLRRDRAYESPVSRTCEVLSWITRPHASNTNHSRSFAESTIMAYRWVREI